MAHIGIAGSSYRSVGLEELAAEHQLEVLRRRISDRELSPVARGLQRSFRELAVRSVAYALEHGLSHLDPANRAAVERLAADLGERMVQVPLRGLRRAAWNHSSAVIRNFVLGLEDEGETGDGGADSG